jgi:peptidoglycan/LPS O-acetylase OafA/YrhL
VVVALALAPEGAVARLLRWKPFRTLGLFSYSLYLVHMPMLRVFEILAQRITRLQGLAWFTTLELIGVPLCVAATYLFFLAFEKPFLSRRRSAPPARERPDVIPTSVPGEL